MLSSYSNIFSLVLSCIKKNYLLPFYKIQNEKYLNNWYLKNLITNLLTNFSNILHTVYTPDN